MSLKMKFYQYIGGCELGPPNKFPDAFIEITFARFFCFVILFFSGGVNEAMRKWTML